MTKKPLNIIQQATGILAMLMFLITFVVTVSINTRGDYWHIFGVGIALFFVSIFVTAKKPKAAGVLLILITSFWIYVLVDCCIRYNGLLFNNAISHAAVSRPWGNIFTIFYVSFMLLGLLLMTIVSFLNPQSAVAPILSIFTPLIMGFFLVANYFLSTLLYEEFYVLGIGRAFSVIAVDIKTGRIVPIFAFLFGFIFLSVSMIIVNLTYEKKEKEWGGVATNQHSFLDENAKNAVRSLPKMVLLLIVTFGIYRIIWIKKAIEFTNRYTQSGRKKDPTLTALLSVLIPGYYSYVAYNLSVTLQNEDENADTSINTVLPIISLVCPIITDLYIQSTINTYVVGKDEAEYVNLKDAKKSPFKVFILSALTCGIYGIFYVYNTSTTFEDVGTTKLSPIAWAILSLIFPPINLWWCARMSKIIDSYYNTQKCTPFVVASALCPPLAYALIQDRINELADL